jgi:hypothetical protein
MAAAGCVRLANISVLAAAWFSQALMSGELAWPRQVNFPKRRRNVGALQVQLSRVIALNGALLRPFSCAGG